MISGTVIAAAEVLPAGGSVPPATAGVAGPDVFFLPDASGKLRRVLGYQYEDFFQSWRAAQAQQQQARPPAYVLDRLIATANADGCCKVHWLTHETNATAIQLYERIAERPGFIQFRKGL